jgi:diacylglycerol kinase (ATP)
VISVLIAVLHNPSAGEGSIDAEDVQAALAAAGHDVEWWDSHEPGWQAALTGSHDLVVAAGGDGTVRKVFTGLAGTCKPAAVLPLGTANNVAVALGAPIDDPLSVIDHWTDGAVIGFDVPSVSADAGSERIVEGVVGGLFAAVLEEAGRRSERPSSDERWSLFREMLAAAGAASWRIECDGEISDHTAIGVHAMNVGRAGPSVPIAPQAVTSDGRIDVIVIEPEHAATLDAYADARLRSRSAPLEIPAFTSARHVRLVPPAEHRLAFDDAVRPTGAVAIDAGAGRSTCSSARPLPQPSRPAGDNEAASAARLPRRRSVVVRRVLFTRRRGSSVRAFLQHRLGEHADDVHIDEQGLVVGTSIRDRAGNDPAATAVVLLLQVLVGADLPRDPLRRIACTPPRRRPQRVDRESRESQAALVIDACVQVVLAHRRREPDVQRLGERHHEVDERGERADLDDVLP